MLSSGCGRPDQLLPVVCMNSNDQLYELQSTSGRFTNPIPGQEASGVPFMTIFHFFLTNISPSPALQKLQLDLE